VKAELHLHPIPLVSNSRPHTPEPGQASLHHFNSQSLSASAGQSRFSGGSATDISEEDEGGLGDGKEIQQRGAGEGGEGDIVRGWSVCPTGCACRCRSVVGRRDS
jgi:hypothetical protein